MRGIVYTEFDSMVPHGKQEKCIEHQRMDCDPSSGRRIIEF
jgi:hypothetical protein